MGLPWSIICGDVRRVCKTLEARSFDAVLSDPPYGLSILGNRWDYSVPSALTWSEVERVMKPGAHALIFGGSRTFHRVCVAAEDGGLIPRDLIMWIYGQGMPKSQNTSKAMDKHLGATRRVVGVVNREGGESVNTLKFGFKKEYDVTVAATEEAERWEGFGTALKPSFEPVLLARKMLDGTVAQNALKWGVGPIGIDASRLPLGVEEDTTREPSKVASSWFSDKPQGSMDDSALLGRWPTNVILSHSYGCSVDRCMPDCPVRMMDEQSGERPGMSGGGNGRTKNMFGVVGRAKPEHARADSGGASRFYYVAKADRYQRAAGGDGNDHPTLKPIDLNRYLATLILPPPRPDRSPRRILVPYCGVASEVIGCLQAGWDEVVGVELDPKFAEIARRRITSGGVLTGLMDKKMRRRKAR